MRVHYSAAFVWISILASPILAASNKNQIAQAKKSVHQSSPGQVSGANRSSSTFKSFVVSFDDSVASHVIEDAMRHVQETQGTVTHVFNTLIKGFSAVASDNSMEQIKTLSTLVTVEEDQVLHAT